MSRWIAGIVLLAFIALACAGCRTVREIKKEAVPSAQVPFSPGLTVAPIQYDKGPYPDLFAATSQAIWVSEAVTGARWDAARAAGEGVTAEEKVEAEQIARDYLIIECRLESVFGDMSIAYDVVGGRGVRMCLCTPGGGKVYPVQVLAGEGLTETGEGALRRFGRSVLLVFARQDVWAGTGFASRDVGAVRLYIEGHGTSYYFEWPRAGARAEVWTPEAPGYGAVAGMKFKAFLDALRESVKRFS